MFFNLHGIGIEVEASEGLMSEVATEGMDYFYEQSNATEPHCALSLSEGPATAPTAGGEWEPLSSLDLEKGRISLRLKTWQHREGRDQLLIDFESKATALIDYPDKRIEVVVHDADFFRSCYDPLYTSSVLFKSLLLELLPCWDVFPLHAGMCSAGGSGVVICGEPGAGKSLLLLLLCSNGFSFMSDELGMLKREGDGLIDLLSFPIRAKLWRNPVALAHLKPGEPLVGLSQYDDKFIYSPIEAALTISDRSRGRIILVVTGITEGDAKISLLDGFEAAQWLLMYDVYYSSRHQAEQFSICADLANQSRCYEVVIGADVDSLLNQIRAIARYE